MGDLTDHDMLIRIDTNVGHIKTDVTALKLADHKKGKRVASLERSRAWAKGALKIITIVLGLSGVVFALVKSL